jgi:nucleoside-diphosphate-sugar epimerase
MMKKVLLTGASGFIGHHCLTPLHELGYEIHAVSSQVREAGHTPIEWHQVDLRDHRQVAALLTQTKPTHLLHLAWDMVPGKYVDSPENIAWVQGSLELVRQFVEHAGKRAVIAGSSFEYDWNYGYCSEFITPKVPSSFYGACKHALHQLVAAYAKTVGLSVAWGRIFFLYGPREHPSRLVSSVIRSLVRGEPARCSHGKQIRDYLHVQDVADALVAVLQSEVQGPVNIASGQPVALREIILQIGQQLQRPDLLQIGALPARANDLPLVVADIQRLTTEVGWQQKYDMQTGLDHTIQWWKESEEKGTAL